MRLYRAIVVFCCAAGAAQAMAEPSFSRYPESPAVVAPFLVNPIGATEAPWTVSFAERLADCLCCQITNLRLGGQPGDAFIGPTCNNDGTYRLCFYLTGTNFPADSSQYVIEIDGVAYPIALLATDMGALVLCVTGLPEAATGVDVSIRLNNVCGIEAVNFYDAPRSCPGGACVIDAVRLGGQPGDAYIGPTCNDDETYRTCFYVSGVNLPAENSSYLVEVDGVAYPIAFTTTFSEGVVVCVTGVPSGGGDADVRIRLAPQCEISVTDMYASPNCNCEITGVRVGGQLGDAFIGPTCNNDATYRTCLYISGQFLPAAAASYQIEFDGVSYPIAFLAALSSSQIVVCATGMPAGVGGVDVFVRADPDCAFDAMDLYVAPAQCPSPALGGGAATIDDAAPEITIPPDVTIFCANSVDPNENPALGRATATDDCDDNVRIRYVDDDQTRNCRGKIYRTWTATDNCGNTTSGVQVINVVSRGTTGQKGSLLILPKVEQRYDNAGALTQDTFITISNDSANTQHVKLFYVDGDTWESVDNGFVLTPEEPYYFSLENPIANASGQTPRRFRDVLGGGAPQPDPLGRGGLTVRGFVLIFACDNTFNRPVRNNNLTAKVTIVNYADTEAYEYDATAFQAACVPHGAIIDRSELMLGGDYDYAPGQILADMFADNSEALGGNVLTELTLLVLDMDFRQNGRGPATTFAFFTVHKQDETPLTWQQDYCVTCWDSRLISSIEPSVFDGVIVNADRVKARIETFRNDGICGVESRQAPLLGVMTKAITFTGGPTAYAASEATGQLVEEATIIIGAAQSVPGGELRADEDTPKFRAPGATRETLTP